MKIILKWRASKRLTSPLKNSEGSTWRCKNGQADLPNVINIFDHLEPIHVKLSEENKLEKR
jgi:hypothetical protein